MTTTTPITTAAEILATLEAAGVTAKIWTGGNVTRVYISATPAAGGAAAGHGWVAVGAPTWRAAVANVSNKARWEITRILFP